MGMKVDGYNRAGLVKDTLKDSEALTTLRARLLDPKPNLQCNAIIYPPPPPPPPPPHDHRHH
ncbi:hypothetical protein JZ751_011047 [Albula glossodonta]|uniref:Uncharacterized protein n=1 Tax=Albula glossodonta TaxID=121402 RepID=A0A8T2P471_9TELE|nr:hypothetical protein JZ751_011047 [Albula glossodonta]